MARIVVTGGSGKAGRPVVQHLLEHGHEVLNVDLVGSPESSSPDTPVPFLAADLTDYGQAVEAIGGGERLAGIEAVVHLAAIPSPVHATPARTFATNATTSYNVFAAAALHGVRRIVWASSETALGLPFGEVPPRRAPVDEEHTFPNSAYALSKVAGEEMARQFHRWTQIPIVGLRLSNVMVRADYAGFAAFQDDPHLRRWNLWGYVDESHVAEGVRRALEAGISGAHVVNLAAPDTVMERPSRELMAEVFPGVEVDAAIAGRDSLIDISRARELLGYDPQFSWRSVA